MELCDRIKYLRHIRGKTLDEIAKSVGVNNATVSRWESGQIKNIRMDKLLPLSNALETSRAYLLGIIDDPNDMSFNTVALEMALTEHERLEQELAAEYKTQKEERERAIDAAVKHHMEVVMRICRDPLVSSDADRAWENLHMPGRIVTITDFIERNADFLHKNMPGLIPKPASDPHTENKEDGSDE